MKKKKTSFNSELEGVLRKVALPSPHEPMVLGSYLFKENLWYGDVDLLQNVTNLKAEDLQGLVQSLLDDPDYFLGDIKCGHFEPYRVISDNLWLDEEGKIRNFNREEILNKIKKLPFRPSEKALVAAARGGLDEIKKHLRFHVIRWTPSEIAKGWKILEGGVRYTLEEAVRNPGLVKVDFIRFMKLDGNFGEFSIVYNTPKSTVPLSRKKSLMSDVRLFLKSGQYFKALKRLASLDPKIFSKIVNQKSLGILYQSELSLKNLLFILSQHTRLIKDDRIRVSLDNVFKKLNFLPLPESFYTKLKEGKILELWLRTEELLNDLALKALSSFRSL